MSQKVDWIRDYVSEYEGKGIIKVDNAGNIFVVNGYTVSQNKGVINKLDANGNLLWSVSLSFKGINGSSDSKQIKFTLDPEGNLYGVFNFSGLEGFDLTAENGVFLVGKSSEQIHDNIHDEKAMTFKITKDGEYKWSTLVSAFTYHMYYSNLVYDEYTNQLYQTGSYSYYLKTTKTTLSTPATSHRDLALVVFIQALDAETGEEKVLKNLHLGLAGTLIPLSDRLSYTTTERSNSFNLHLTREGEIQRFKPSSTYIEPDETTGTDVRVPFIYQAGYSTYETQIPTWYDPHNKLRKVDLYGEVIAEKEFSEWNDFFQYKDVVFSSFGIQSLDENNTMALVAGAHENLQKNTVQYDGETLSASDLRFILFDRDLNIKKKVPLRASNFLFLSSFQYSRKDKAFYILFNSSIQTQITLAGRTFTIGGDGNYNSLLKVRFDDLGSITDQNDILSLLLDQQTKAAQIDRVNKLVTTFVGPGTNLTNLEAKLFISEKARLKEPLHLPLDLSTPKKIKVISETGKEEQWTIQVNKDYATGNRIELVEFPGQIKIEQDTLIREITVTVDRNMDLKNLSLSKFQISQFAAVSPDPFSIKDFSQAQPFIVTAENGEIAEWKILVKRRLSQEKNILDFSLKDQLKPSRINDIDRVIEVELASYADWHNTIEGIALSPGAEIIPAINELHDFSKKVFLTVKAEDGGIVTWTILANKADKSDLKEAVKVYPVPADRVLFINLQFVERAPAVIELTTLDGRYLLQKQLEPTPITKITLDLKSYAPGIYFLRLIHANQIYIKRILIQH